MSFSSMYTSAHFSKENIFTGSDPDSKFKERKMRVRILDHGTQILDSEIGSHVCVEGSLIFDLFKAFV